MVISKELVPPYFAIYLLLTLPTLNRRTFWCPMISLLVPVSQTSASLLGLRIPAMRRRHAVRKL